MASIGRWCFGAVACAWTRPRLQAQWPALARVTFELTTMDDRHEGPMIHSIHRQRRAMLGAAGKGTARAGSGSSAALHARPGACSSSFVARTPLVRLGASGSARGRQRVGKSGVHEPRRQRQRSPGALHDSRRRASGAH